MACRVALNSTCVQLSLPVIIVHIISGHLVSHKMCFYNNSLYGNNSYVFQLYHSKYFEKLGDYNTNQYLCSKNKYAINDFCLVNTFYFKAYYEQLFPSDTF